MMGRLVGTTRRTRLAAALIAVLAIALFGAACTELPEDYPTPTPLPTPVDTNKPVYEVKRGSIVQTVKGLGRIAASEEETYYFQQSGRLHKLYVEVGSEVKNGDLLAELETGTLKTRIAEAKLNLDIAELRLAEAADKSAGNTDVSGAAASVAQAEADYARAVAALNELRAGIQTGDRASLEQAVADARANLESAEGELARLRAGPTEDELRSAALTVDQARANLVATQVSRDNSCARVDRGHPDCVSANARVGAAEAALQKALADEAAVKAGATPDEIAAAEQRVVSAQAALTAAQARLDEANAGAGTAEIEIAEKTVESAKAALDAAKANLELKIANAARGGDYELQIQQKNVELARIGVAELEQELAMAQIHASMDGIVIDTRAKDGDQVQAFTGIVTVANPTDLEVAFEVSAADLSKVQVDQDAVFTFITIPNETFTGKVISVPSQGVSADPQLASAARTVRMSFEAPQEVRDKLKLGDLVNISIATLKKDDVLILPNTAIRIFGGRRFVRVAEPSGRRVEVDVEVGIADETMTEITRGLDEGDLVIAP